MMTSHTTTSANNHENKLVNHYSTRAIPRSMLKACQTLLYKIQLLCVTTTTTKGVVIYFFNLPWL